MTRIPLAWALFALGICSFSAALQFDVDSGRTKCLGEVIGKHDLVKGGYSILDLPQGARSGVEVKILSPSDGVEYSSNDQPSGKFAFTGNEPGSHRVCFTNVGPGKRRVSLEFAAGADAKDYTDIAKKEHLKPIELELRKLEDRVSGIAQEMQYQREREEAHRNTSESTNSRVQWFSILTIAIVVTQTVLQLMYLRSDWKKKKII